MVQLRAAAFTGRRRRRIVAQSSRPSDSTAAPGRASDWGAMEGRRGSRRRAGRPPARATPDRARTGDADRERARHRARSAQASRVILHALGWVLVVFYATDYLPPLAVRWLAAGPADRVRLYLVGYCALGLICWGLGAAFGGGYRRAIRASRYPQRWLVFPTVLAVLLIPAQGWNEWLSRGVEVVACLAGIHTGLWLRSRSRWRWRSRSPG
ncbi:MAG TPA: hypothetical protein VMW47_10090 [Verrucomicrobiae bacterium]|nr:hypothetical protein [Verrucomicrobiae bacterium]